MTMLPVMLDSGAYSAMRKGKAVLLKDYIAFLLKLKQDRHFGNFEYINLDVIGNGRASYENWLEMRQAGLDPMPVYHVTTEEAWLQKYLEQTDRIGLGAIANMMTSKRVWALDRIWCQYLLGENKCAKYKVHGMGITSFALLRRYPWYSVDSTRCLKFASFGGVLVPPRREGAWQFQKVPNHIWISNKSKRRHVKGEHFKTLSPLEQTIVAEFLSDMGYTADELADSFLGRYELNCLVFARYVESVGPWTRPFLATKPRGITE